VTMRLLLADLDGTLVETWRETPLPGIPERLAGLRAQGVTVAVVTNQGGVGYRYAHEQRSEWAQAARYPTLDQVLIRLEAITGVIPIRRIYTCLHHGQEDWPVPTEWADGRIEQYSGMAVTWRADWRKPAPGMLLQALKDLGVAPSEALMVGDRPEDQAAALAAGVPFQWVGFEVQRYRNVR
jgi:D-glycero-D-manno-heptose 1,7-bisphosphate phosphatase